MRQLERPGLINLAAGVPNPDLLPVTALKKAFADANRRSGKAMWAYQTPEGHAGLREQIALRLSRRKCPVKAGQIIVTTGCTQALHLALRTLVKPGEIVACESPCYYNLLEQIHDTGARALPLPTDMNRGLRLDETERLIKRHRPKCLVVCSSLSNPTGATLSVPARRALVKMCRHWGVLLVEDDIYGELCDNGAPPPLRAFDDGSVVVYVTSFCKSVSPGLRVGCLIAGPAFEKAVRLKCQADLHSSVVAEATLCEFMRAGEMDGHLRALRTTCVERRKLVREAVQEYFPTGTRVSNPQGGFLLWVELPQPVNAEKWSDAAMQRGVSFARGEVFLTGPAQRGCLRLNCAKAALRDLRKGIQLLAECLNSL